MQQALRRCWAEHGEEIRVQLEAKVIWLVLLIALVGLV